MDIQSCADCFLYFGGIAATISGNKTDCTGQFKCIQFS